MDFVAQMLLLGIIDFVGLTYPRLIELSAHWGLDPAAPVYRYDSFTSQLTGVPDNLGEINNV